MKPTALINQFDDIDFFQNVKFWHALWFKGSIQVVLFWEQLCFNKANSRQKIIWRLLINGKINHTNGLTIYHNLAKILSFFGHLLVKTLLRVFVMDSSVFVCSWWFETSHFVIVRVSRCKRKLQVGTHLVESKVIYWYKSRFLLGRWWRQTNSGELADKQQVTSRKIVEHCRSGALAVKSCPQLGSWWGSEWQFSWRVSGQLISCGEKATRNTNTEGRGGSRSKHNTFRGEDRPNWASSPTSRNVLVL